MKLAGKEETKLLTLNKNKTRIISLSWFQFLHFLNRGQAWHGTVKEQLTIYALDFSTKPKFHTFSDKGPDL